MKLFVLLGGASLLASCGSSGTAPAGPPAFAQCATCHGVTPGGGRGAGPNLAGVVGRKAGQSPGFNYSPALRDSGITWSAATLDQYLTDPRKMVPGTRMQSAVRDPAARKAIIDYLQKP